MSTELGAVPDAVANAAPRLLFKGASLGALGGIVGFESGRRTLNHLRAKKTEREAAAKEAKEAEDQLRAIVRDGGDTPVADDLLANDRIEPPAAPTEDGE